MARPPFSSWCLPAILLLSCTNSSPASNFPSKATAAAADAALAPLPGNETDRISLLAFKAGIDDPTGALRSWDERLHICRWRGVVCGRRHPDRVVGVRLASSRLGGNISPSIFNLTFVREIDLSDNGLDGAVHQDVGRLSRLQLLNLSYNSLAGEIPANVSRCLNLKHIILKHNQLIGEIPAALGSLPALVGMNFYGNKLVGAIPPSLGNLSSLSTINIGRNGLTGGIPAELGRLTELEVFSVGENMLSGEVPPAIYNLSRVTKFSVSYNNLSGTIPSDIGTRLPRLSWLLAGYNRFHGPIPNSLSNASSLAVIELLHNSFSGTVPANFGGLKFLFRFTVGRNRLEAHEPAHLDFLTSLSNCTLLRRLSIELNQLGGALPKAMGNFSTSLQSLTMGANRISGSIPEGMANLRGLELLAMEQNQFSGSIPAALGKLENLVVLSLGLNRLSGEIPPALGNLTRLTHFLLVGNRLVGSIPNTLGDYRQLHEMDLSGNNLSGTIPDELSNLRTVVAISLSGNSLVGSLPAKLGGLSNLGGLDLSQNQLTGEIPAAAGGWSSMQQLSLVGNFFSGSIPPSLGDLKALEELDLSLNNLTGRIPEPLGELKSLFYLNLSFNNLEGEVPKNGVFANASGIFLRGNQMLCGGIAALKLPACPNDHVEGRGRRGMFRLRFLKIGIPVGVLLFLLFCFTVGYLYRTTKARNPHPAAAVLLLEDRYKQISYGELLKATSGFSSSNLVGTGSFGSVYKGILDGHEKPVAIKVLNLQRRGASKSFMAECEVLKNARHRNLVTIITACSSADFSGGDFKALVFDYMPNGSLDGWLHAKGDVAAASARPPLDFEQRVSIAVDVAAALDYLHNHCHTPIVHCDLKPANVLLDEEMTAHVTDFGLARFLMETPTEEQSSTIGIKGSVGYVAPEYGLGGPISKAGDVYSFGILILELFTGRRPVHDTFKDGASLRAFAETALPDQAADVIDPGLLVTPSDREERLSAARGSGLIWGCFLELMRLGLACTQETPRQRMEMRDVLSEIQAIHRSLRAKGDERNAVLKLK